MDYGKYMRRALALAKQAAAVGEVPVGAVLVCGGEIVAEAVNSTEAQGSALAHAELLVLQSAAVKLGRRYFSDCTLFVTMEPCPMCAGAIVLARVGTVVYGCPDSRWGGCGSIFNVPEHKQSGFKPQLVGGVCEEECRELLQMFFRQRRGV
jgi:tRNA(adenine34) deaminase